MAKPGRKRMPENEKRKHLIACRLTDAELKKLNSGKPAGMTQGEWLRTKALKRKLPKKIPELNQGAYTNLGKSLGKFTQLVNYFLNHSSDKNSTEILSEIKAVRQEIQKTQQFLIGMEGLERAYTKFLKMQVKDESEN